MKTGLINRLSLQIASLTTGTGILSNEFTVLGYGAQNSYTTACSKVAVDILPKRTNVTVALYAITATGEPTTAPTNLPTSASLQSYLNSVYGQQANVYFTVWPLITNSVAYDSNMNGKLDMDLGEFVTITNNVNTNATIIIYYIHTVAVGGNPGGAATLRFTPYTFVSDTHSNSVENITAHEIGHHLGIIYDVTPPV